MTVNNLKQVIKGVFASLIGIQSESNRKKDFASNSPAAYIIVGIFAIVLFVLSLIAIVSLVI